MKSACVILILMAVACEPDSRPPCDASGCTSGAGSASVGSHTGSAGETPSGGSAAASETSSSSATDNASDDTGPTVATTGEPAPDPGPRPVCVPDAGACGYHADCCEGVCSAGRCVPPAPDCETCASLGKTCGDWSNGCDGMLHCGLCAGNAACVAGQCECRPLGCTDYGVECGEWDDGCGGQVDCGGCGDDYDCDQGACVPACTHEKFIFENAMVNYKTYSIACDSQLMEYAYMYICDQNDVCSPAISAGESVAYEVAWGKSETIHSFCCYSDGTTCFGQEHICNIGGGLFPCMCVETEMQLIADVCPSEHVIACY